MGRLRALLAGGAATLMAAGFLTAATFLAGAPAAKAASLVQVTNFGNNPSNLQMYIYVPNNVRPNPPILLALHQCTGSGPGFYSGTAFASLADQYGFIVIYPSVTRSGSCWDVSSSQALTRNGGSDPVGLMSMINYTEQHYGGNPNQVYVTGASSGAMMTNVMLADYPDVFKAGAAFMGVPYYCFFTGTVDGWNSACANGQVSMTAQAWGNLVRNTADPGYSGPRPRMQLWHGTADTTLNYENFGQEILQWTNVLGVSSTPTSTTTPQPSWTETQYDNTSGAPQVEAFSIAGAGHVLPIGGQGMETNAIDFFGLNNVTTGNQVSVTNPGNQTSTAGTAVSLQIHATDSAAGQTLTYSASGLPAGLSIGRSTGLISGTPTTAGTSSVTVTATDGTGASGSAAFSWTIGSGGGTGSCQVMYQTTSQWTGGFTANVTITNTGSTAISGWKLGFTFPGDQKITNSWNGAANQSGETVSITNASYNGAIAPGANTSVGFQGTWTNSDAAPTSFTLNGATCTT